MASRFRTFNLSTPNANGESAAVMPTGQTVVGYSVAPGGVRQVHATGPDSAVSVQRAFRLYFDGDIAPPGWVVCPGGEGLAPAYIVDVGEGA